MSPRHHPLEASATAPGPTLDDVRAQLDEDADRRREPRAGARALVDEVEAALSEEAAEMLEHTELDLRDTAVSVPAAALAATKDEHDEANPKPTHVRHRFAPRSDEEARAARVVVLRNRRLAPPGDESSTPPELNVDVNP